MPALAMTTFLLALVAAPQPVSFPTSDGGLVVADLYGSGERGVVLAHGGRFDKESWAPQARAIAAAGFRVLAFDFRGYGRSHGPGDADVMSAPLHLDVLAAVRYLRKEGARTVSVVGGSMGATAAADAATEAPGEVDRLVLLAGVPSRPADRLGGRKLFVVSRDDVGGGGRRLPRVRAAWDRAPPPKRLLILDGAAHAQFIFQTPQGERLTGGILRFLKEP